MTDALVGTKWEGKAQVLRWHDGPRESPAGPRLIKHLLCAVHCLGCEHSGRETDAMPSLEGRHLLEETAKPSMTSEMLSEASEGEGANNQAGGIERFGRESGLNMGTPAVST